MAVAAWRAAQPAGGRRRPPVRPWQGNLLPGPSVERSGFSAGGGMSVCEGNVSMQSAAVPGDPSWNDTLLALSAAFEDLRWRSLAARTGTLPAARQTPGRRPDHAAAPDHRGRPGSNARRSIAGLAARPREGAVDGRRALRAPARPRRARTRHRPAGTREQVARPVIPPLFLESGALKRVSTPPRRTAAPGAPSAPSFPP